MTSQRMQSTSIQNNVQTARQFTQRISNTVQQQRNVMNNQSVLREVIVILYIYIIILVYSCIFIFCNKIQNKNK
jgi:hypothetical protein